MKKNPLFLLESSILFAILMIVFAVILFKECSFVIAGCGIMLIGISLFYYVKKRK